MGTWGAELYEDDDAQDIRGVVRLVLKLPKTPEELLDILISNVDYDISLDSLEGQTFWLITSDLFERAGISSSQVFENANQIIENGSNLKLLYEHGLDEQLKQKRDSELRKLQVRIKSPRIKKKKISQSPPKFMPSQGEVFSFPTMKGKAFNAWGKSWEELGFVPDGWGALIIVSVGRVFDWFPWCAYSSLNTLSDREPNLTNIPNSKIIFREGGSLTVQVAAPKKIHFDRMKLTKIGELVLDSSIAESLIDTTHYGPNNAVICDWSICNEAFNRDIPHLTSVKVNSIIRKTGSDIQSQIKGMLKKYLSKNRT